MHNDTIYNEALKLIANDATTAQVRGFLAYKGIGSADIKEFLTKEGLAGRKSFIDDFRRVLLEGYTSREVLKDMLARSEYSDNERKHVTARERERLFANKMHEKYTGNNPDNESFEKEEAKLKGFKYYLQLIISITHEGKYIDYTPSQIKEAKRILSTANSLKAKEAKRSSKANLEELASLYLEAIKILG